MQCACAILSSESWPVVLYSSTLSHKRQDFRKDVFEHKMYGLIFSTNLIYFSLYEELNHTELATKTENKIKRNQVITYNIHPEERQLSRNKHQSNSPTTGRTRKILRTTLWLQTELECTHYQETETNWLKSKRNQLVNREKIQPVYRKQKTILHSGDQTHLDLRNRTLGMCQQVQHSNYAESTIKNSQNRNKFSLVCDKPYPPYRP
jgi:hypothetical protein